MVRGSLPGFPGLTARPRGSRKFHDREDLWSSGGSFPERLMLTVLRAGWAPQGPHPETADHRGLSWPCCALTPLVLAFKIRCAAEGHLRSAEPQ